MEESAKKQNVARSVCIVESPNDRTLCLSVWPFEVELVRCKVDIPLQTLQKALERRSRILHLENNLAVDVLGSNLGIFLCLLYGTTVSARFKRMQWW